MADSSRKTSSTVKLKFIISVYVYFFCSEGCSDIMDCLDCIVTFRISLCNLHVVYFDFQGPQTGEWPVGSDGHCKVANSGLAKLGLFHAGRADT